MKQTAVEWLCEQYHLKQDIEIVKQAKEMEKQQIIDARVNGVCEGIDIGARPIGKPITEDISKNHEIYYNETFKNK
jgi:hypothetical protein